MKRSIRIGLGSAVLAAGVALAGAPAANAQVRVGGSFRLPHGRISFSVGDRFPIGGYVPYGYDVYEDAEYGYGFPYEDQWIPCEPRGTHFVIIGEPVLYGHRDRDYRYGRSYRYDRYGSFRDGRRWDRDRRWRRDDSRRYDRRDRDHRWSRDRDRRWDR